MDGSNGPHKEIEEMKKFHDAGLVHVTIEAAKRVMAAEERANRVQREIDEFQEEVQKIHTRMKNDSDSKIGELEAELHMSKAVVNDLRTELQEVNKRVEKMKKIKAHRSTVVNDLRTELQEVKERVEKMKKNKAHLLNENAAEQSSTSNDNASNENQLINGEPNMLYSKDADLV